MRSLSELVQRADPDELLLAVDRLVAGNDWDGLVTLAGGCRAAVEMGQQLWAVAMHIDYRLALAAPPAYVGPLLVPGAARFAPGPLTEVAASRLRWEQLAPYLGDALGAATVAQERALRGEDLRQTLTEQDAELPLYRCGWEPSYALPRYRDHGASHPQPAGFTVSGAPRPVPSAPVLTDDGATGALRALVEPWTAWSEANVACVTVSGRGQEAVGALLERDHRRPEATLAPLSPPEALAVLQWCGASGGAQGRRPGGARGRNAAWWAAACLAGLDWPCAPAALGEAVGQLRWWAWAPPQPPGGWVLRLAVEDPVDELAWAVEAVDIHPADATVAPETAAGANPSDQDD